MYTVFVEEALAPHQIENYNTVIQPRPTLRTSCLLKMISFLLQIWDYNIILLPSLGLVTSCFLKKLPLPHKIGDYNTILLPNTTLKPHVY